MNKTLILPLREFAIQIECEMGNFFKQPVAGWYTMQSLRPTFFAGTAYYSKEMVNGVPTPVPMTDPNTCRGDIYKADDDTLVYRNDEYPRPVWYNGPIEPITGLAVIREFIEAQLESQALWLEKKKPLAARIESMLAQNHDVVTPTLDGEEITREFANQIWRANYPSAWAKQHGLVHYRRPDNVPNADKLKVDRHNEVSVWIEERLRGMLANLTTMLTRFTDNDPWHVFSLTTMLDDAIITREPDFRVAAWTNQELLGLNPFIEQIQHVPNITDVRSDPVLAGKLLSVLGRCIEEHRHQRGLVD